MTPHRIDIPHAKPIATQDAAVNIIAVAVEEAGLDAIRAAKNAMMPGMVREWLEGRWTRGTFIKACRNLAILNPSLLKD